MDKGLEICELGNLMHGDNGHSFGTSQVGPVGLGSIVHDCGFEAQDLRFIFANAGVHRLRLGFMSLG